jgi:hypothetical protein
MKNLKKTSLVKTNPLPFIVRNPPRITVSNTKIHLKEDMPKSRKRFGMGTTTAKIIVVTGEDNRFLGGNS